jgi:hypothetical protein
MVSEPGDVVGKSWPKESRSPHSRFRGTAKQGPVDRRANAVAADHRIIEVSANIENILENLRDRFGGTVVVE